MIYLQTQQELARIQVNCSFVRLCAIVAEAEANEDYNYHRHHHHHHHTELWNWV